PPAIPPLPPLPERNLAAPVPPPALGQNPPVPVSQAPTPSLPSIPTPPSFVKEVSLTKPAIPAGALRQFLNTTHATVEYRIDQVGPSGVGKVEVYLTGN